MSASLSRFQIIEGNPPNLPHQCTICGSISGTFVDFQLDLEFYGTVYFCMENCFTQLANELGYRSPAQHHLALEKIAELREQLNKSEEEAEELRNAVGTLRRLDGRDSGSNSPSVYDSREGKRDNPSIIETESGLDESATKQGSTNFFNDDGLNDLLSNS